MFRLLAIAMLFAAAPARADDPPPATPPPAQTTTQEPPTTFRLCIESVKTLQPKATTDATQKVVATIQAVVSQAQAAEAAHPGDGDKVAQAGVDQINAAAADVPKDDPAAQAVNVTAARLNNSAGNPGDAESFASRAIDQDPDARDAYIERAAARVGLEHYGAALADANQAVALNPQGADGYRTRAMAEFDLHDYQQAGEDARRALALDPADQTSFAIMKLVEGRVPKVDVDKLTARMAGEIMGEYHGMLSELDEADQRRQGQPGLWPNASAGAAAAAAQTLAQPPASSPATALVQNAAAQLVGKDYAGAIAQADKAIAADPNNVAAYYYRSTADNLLGDYDAAEKDATQALALNPSDAPSHDARAFALNHLGHFRDAIADSNHSLEINPDNAYAFANLGYAHERMGDLSAMLRDFKTAATLNAQFEPAYRDAAARHGLPFEPVTDDGLAQEQARRAAQARAQRNQFLFVVGSSIVGGLLIAFGFIQLFGSSKPAVLAPPATRSAARSGPAPRAGPAGPTSMGAAYALGKEIGVGGMGVVYEGFDRALQRKVAIKAVRDEFKKDEAARQRFLEEARTVAALHHPGIVDIHTIVEDGSDVYLVFEFVEGRTLHEILAQRGRLPFAEAKAVAGQICRALDFAHRRGVVHRDLKPANVMVGTDGTVKLMDFGISRHADVAVAAGASAAEGRTGTPDYMAPEQNRGAVRPESDIFSLGACFYEMLTGRRPFPAGHGPLDGSFVRASSIVPDLPPGADVFLDWAMNPDPEKRIRSARDFWALLERVRCAPAA